jgi:hypothetical protein
MLFGIHALGARALAANNNLRANTTPIMLGLTPVNANNITT